jgi:hypothetical protein
MVRTTINIVIPLENGMPCAFHSSIKTPEQLIEELTAKVASLEAELAIQKGIVAELLKKLYGAKSEKLDHNHSPMPLVAMAWRKSSIRSWWRWCIRAMAAVTGWGLPIRSW